MSCTLKPSSCRVPEWLSSLPIHMCCQVTFRSNSLKKHFFLSLVSTTLGSHLVYICFYVYITLEFLPNPLYRLIYWNHTNKTHFGSFWSLTGNGKVSSWRTVRLQSLDQLRSWQHQLYQPGWQFLQQILPGLKCSERRRQSDFIPLSSSISCSKNVFFVCFFGSWCCLLPSLKCLEITKDTWTDYVGLWKADLALHHLVIRGGRGHFEPIYLLRQLQCSHMHIRACLHFWPT